MKNRIDFLGVPVDNLSMSQTLDKIDNAIINNNQIHHCVINAAKVVEIQNNIKLKESVLSSNIINADGMSIIWAARFLGKRIKERVAGIDLMEKLVELAHKKKYTCFFLGAKEQVIKKIVKNYSDKYSYKIISGYRNG